jgi:hypothetical protein
MPDGLTPVWGGSNFAFLQRSPYHGYEAAKLPGSGHRSQEVQSLFGV